MFEENRIGIAQAEAGLNAESPIYTGKECYTLIARALRQAYSKGRIR